MPPKKRALEDISNEPANLNISSCLIEFGFTETNFSNILNQNLQPNQNKKNELYKNLSDTLLPHLPALQKLKDNGFDLISIAGTLYGAGPERYKEGVSALVNNIDRILDLKSKGLGVHTLLSALKGVHIGIPSSITAIEKNMPVFQALMALGFEDPNISAIVAASGRTINDLLMAIQSNLPTFNTLITDYKFAAKNISGILHSAGTHAAKCVQSLTENLHIIKIYLDIGYLPENISTMLYGKAGVYFDAILKKLEEKQALFKDFIIITRSSTLCSRLHKIPGRDFIAALDQIAPPGLHITEDEIDEMHAAASTLFMLNCPGYFATIMPSDPKKQKITNTESNDDMFVMKKN
jgi:hypothetical protein